jgi:dihydrofolate reductase
VAALKAEGHGFVTVLSSAALAQTLLAHDLVDTCHLMVHPLVLGAGRRLCNELPHPLRLRLRLVDATTTATGVVMLTYERAGGDEHADERGGGAVSSSP